MAERGRVPEPGPFRTELTTAPERYVLHPEIVPDT
jgi:hypothetical protein